jgi:hypothetical protein
VLWIVGNRLMSSLLERTEIRILQRADVIPLIRVPRVDVLFWSFMRAGVVSDMHQYFIYTHSK